LTRFHLLFKSEKLDIKFGDVVVMKKYGWKLYLFSVIFFLNAISSTPLINPNFFKNLVSPLLKSNKHKQFNALKTELLKNLPFSDELGIVKESFLVPLKDAYAPYNPSAVFQGDHIELVYRQDVKIEKPNSNMNYNTFIKRTLLNRQFQQLTTSETINTRSLTSEDPRIITDGSSKFLIFNDLRKAETSKTRIISLMNLNETKPKPVPLELGLNWYEKNWTPFICNNQIHFVYQIIPHKVVTLNDKGFPQMENKDTKFDMSDFSFWKWGTPRGGTPAIEYKGEYLSFFHSSFHVKDKTIYVMGAYTFQKEEPFKITQFSRFPIIFKDIYKAPIINTSDRCKRVIFPSGLIYDDKKDEFLVFCGENDSAIRVIKIDPSNLKLNLKPILEEKKKDE
jgi:predicted GH43/DUF377 family glycosyl hydrolase